MNIKHKQPNLIKALSYRNDLNHYNRWIYNKIKKYVGKRILDIGSGTGNLVELLVQSSQYIFCSDLFPENIEYMRKRFKDNSKVEFLLGDFLNPYMSFDNYSFDTITCINVLEHIENDFEAIKKMKDIVEFKGKIILLVPAFQSLYGTMDVASGHYRRYNPGILRQYAKELALKVIDNFYFNIFGVFPWYLNGRVLKKNRPYSETLGQKKIGLYNKVVPVLEKLDEFNPFPIGISEIIVLQKD